MVGKITAALAVALVLSSTGFASARPAWQPMSQQVVALQQYDGVTYPHETERYCYMPSSPCDNNHRVTN
jgi:hypothetical protein